MHLLCGGKFVNQKILGQFVEYLNSVTQLVCSEKVKHCPTIGILGANDWFRLTNPTL